MNCKQKCQIVALEIRLGYGVEDIHVKHGIPASEIRQHINRWRDNGILERILKTGKLS